MPAPDPAPLRTTWVVFDPVGEPQTFGHNPAQAWLRMLDRLDSPGVSRSHLESMGYRCVECRLTPIEEPK